MLSGDAIRAILATRGYTQADLAAELGVKQPSISNVITKNDPNVTTLCKYLNRLGYSVCLVPTGGKLPDGSYVLESKKQA